MRRNPSSLHLFLTLLLLAGLLFGAFGQTLVNALGVNANVLGENSAVPVPESFMRQNPASSLTNADTLTFRVTFSEPVSGVEPGDFKVHDNTPKPTTNAPGLTVTPVSNSVYDVRIHGGNLDLFNGIVGLDFSGLDVVNDLATGLPISTTEPTIDETYLVDNDNPTVTIDHQVNGQLDPVTTQPVVFTVVFDEVIDVATFRPGDITQGGTAPSPVWGIVDSGDHMSFTLSGVASGNGTINPLITAGRVNDLTGNGNDPFIKTCDNVVPDNCVTVDDTTRPTVTINQAVGQSDPASTLPVKFTVVFSEPINTTTFTASDITQVGTAPSPVWTITDSGDHQTFELSVTVAGNGIIIPIITEGKVLDLVGNSNYLSGGVDNSVTLYNAAPTVTINQASGQSDPTDKMPIKFTVVFSTVINVSTFTASDITQGGTAPSPVWTITDSGNHKNFTLSVTVAGNGTIIPIIGAERVFDTFGNGNLLSGGTDNSVTLDDHTHPTVTIEQAPGQSDPTSTVPIRFTVTFSESIVASTFTKSDIKQNGDATGILWGISDSGDHKVFTLTAISSGYGTLIPSINAGKVTDIIGNPNDASTSTDNSVKYLQPPPTLPPTRTATPSSGDRKTVVITEVAWMGSAASSSDEWIELYNTTNSLINMDGWHLRSFRYNGRDFSLNLDIVFTAEDIIQPRTSTDPKDTSGYFLLERGFSLTDDNAVMNITADKIYTNFLLSDSGEILLLCSRQNITEGSCNINQKFKVVDFVNGSLTGTGGINPWPAGKGSPLYGSMERKNLISDDKEHWFTHVALAPRYGHDRNWDGSSTGNILNGTPRHPNWAFEVTATPRPTITPTRTPTRRPVSAVPILVINEVLARSGSDWNNDGKVDVYDEFIEVINAGTVNVNLNNYKLDDELNLGSAPYALPNQTLKPGEMTVFYGSQTGIRLEDSGDTVRLIRSSNSAVVDAIAYPLVKTVDSSICRYTDGYGSWINGCFPTPGRPNALVGDRYPSTSNGSPIPVCFLPDSVPEEFVLAECGEDGLGIWNNSYWDSFPGEGKEIWRVDDNDKWLVVYQ